MPVCFKRQEYFSYAFFTCRGNHIRLSASISLFMFVCLLLCAKQFHVPFVSSLAFLFCCFWFAGFVATFYECQKCAFLCEDRHGCWQKGWCEDFNYWNIERVFFFLLNKTLYSFKFVKWAIGRICRKVYPLNILGNPFLQLHICFISLVVCNSWTAFNAKNMQNSVFPHRKNKGG